MAAILSDTRQLVSTEPLLNPYPLIANMLTPGALCPLGSTRAFFVGTHAAVSEMVQHAYLEAYLDTVAAVPQNT